MDAGTLLFIAAPFGVALITQTVVGFFWNETEEKPKKAIRSKADAADEVDAVISRQKARQDEKVREPSPAEKLASVTPVPGVVKKKSEPAEDDRFNDFEMPADFQLAEYSARAAD